MVSFIRTRARELHCQVEIPSFVCAKFAIGEHKTLVVAVQIFSKPITQKAQPDFAFLDADHIDILGFIAALLGKFSLSMAIIQVNCSAIVDRFE